MTDENITIKIATDKHGLISCGCGENQLYWVTKKDYLAHEADHTLDEAREIAEGSLPWNRRNKNGPLKKLFESSSGPDGWNEWVEREKRKAERNGLSAHCKKCYDSMSPTMATNEMADDVQKR